MEQPCSFFDAAQCPNHLVIGSSGGIGGALSRALKQRGLRVFTAARQALDSDLHLDLEDDDSVSRVAVALAERLQGDPLHSVFICSGLLHADGVRPERRIESLNSAAFERVMRVNALGPLRLIAQLKALLPRDQISQISAVSARVGSITDNRLGGWYSYRCSKAALNMGFKTLAVEMRRTHPQCALTLFHPGTTDTPLSAPFQRGVPLDKLFTPERAARQFLDVVSARGTHAGLQFLAWDGQAVDW